MDIVKFRGYNFRLSNFFTGSVFQYHMLVWHSAEAAFQAQKNPALESTFVNLMPLEAKRRGSEVNLRADWEEVKDEIMYRIVKQKFTCDGNLSAYLISTYPGRLIEGNTHGDTYWGQCGGAGENKLGLILERVRYELINNLSKRGGYHG